MSDNSLDTIDYDIDKVEADTSFFAADGAIIYPDEFLINPKIDYTILLNESLIETECFVDYSVVANNFMLAFVEPPRDSLLRLRDSRNIGQIAGAALSRMLGYDIRNDVGIKVTDYHRIISGIGELFDGLGTSDFVSYMGYVRGIELNLVSLWTKDHSNFVPFNQSMMDAGDTIFNIVGSSSTGSETEYFYPSSHVGLSYLIKEDSQVNESVLNDKNFFQQFYELAPINLVLKWVMRQIQVQIQSVYFGFTVMTDIQKNTVQLYSPVQYGNLWVGGSAIQRSERYSKIDL